MKVWPQEVFTDGIKSFCVMFSHCQGRCFFNLCRKVKLDAKRSVKSCKQLKFPHVTHDIMQKVFEFLLFV